jgi:hypothetical protein
MKLSAPVLKTLLLAAVVLLVLPLHAHAAKAAPPQPPAGDRRPADAVPLPGVSVPYEGGWMSLDVERGFFHLRFYDAARELLPAPAIRATARWNPPLKTGFSRTVLLPADEGRALVGNTFVRPPHNFRVYLTLIGANDQVMGSYSIDFQP